MRRSANTFAMVTAIVSLATTVGANCCHAGRITLAWDPSPDTNIVGYALYIGTESGNYSERLDVGNQLTAVVSNLSAGVTYSFVVTAYQPDSIESLPSNEVQYTVPGALGLARASTAGLVGLEFPLLAGEVVAILASENLRDWMVIAELHTDVSRGVQFVDPESARFSRRFYRLRGANVAARPMRLVPLQTATAARVRFVSVPGDWVRLEASENLQDWVTLQELTVATNQWFEFIDPTSATLPHRFYRIRPMNPPTGRGTDSARPIHERVPERGL